MVIGDTYSEVPGGFKLNESHVEIKASDIITYVNLNYNAGIYTCDPEEFKLIENEINKLKAPTSAPRARKRQHYQTSATDDGMVSTVVVPQPSSECGVRKSQRVRKV